MAAPAAGVPVYNPETGQLEHVAPEQASAQLRTRQVRPSASKLSIVRGNEVREIDPSKLSEAESYGWALVDDEGVRAARVRAEEDTLAGAAQGTAEQFASGATFGLSDLAAVKLLGADPERMRARAKAAADLGEAARLGGEVLPVALSGGTGAGARGAVSGTVRGLGVLPRAVEAAGIVAEKGVQRALGKGLAGRAGGAFVRGGIEAAASGMGEEIHESVLGERDLVAERVLTQGAMAGLFGGGASMAFPLTGALLNRATKVPNKAAAEVLGKATGGDPANLGGVAEIVTTGVTGKPLSPSRKILREMGKGAEGRKLVNEVAHDLDGVTQRSAAQAKAATSDFAERMRDVVRKTEQDRTENMRRMFGAADDEIVPGRVLGEMESLMQRLDDDGYRLLEEYGPGEVSKRHLDTMRGEMQRAWDEIVEKGSSAADAHTRLLGVKRRARELARDVGRMDSKAQTTNQILRNLERQVSSALGSDEFGKAAQAWREMSKADALALQSADELFKTDRITGARKGKNLLGRVLNGEATDAEILTFTKRIGNPRYADQAGAAEDYFRRQIEAAEIRAKHSADAAMQTEVKELRKGYDAFRKTMKQQAKVADIADAFRASGRGALPGVLAAFGPSGATITGSLLGGAPGAMVGGALSALARPGSTLRTLAAVSHLADKAGVDVDAVINRAINMDPKTAAKSALSAAGRGARKAARGVGKAAGKTRGVASRAVGRAVVSRSEDQRAKQRRAEELADPDTLTRELAQQMYALTDAAPGIAGSAAEKVGVAAAFLADKLPPEISDPVTGRKRIIDPATRDAFDRYHEAVTDPVATLGRLEDGTMTLEHAEALREVWPALYEDVQGKVFEGLQAAADEGREVPYTRRKSLGILFDLPTVPEMTPEYRQAVEALIGGEMEAENARAEMEANAKEDGAQAKLARKTDFKSPKRYGMTLSRIERNDV